MKLKPWLSVLYILVLILGIANSANASLVAYWKLDEMVNPSVGTTAVDSSSNGHHGTYVQILGSGDSPFVGVVSADTFFYGTAVKFSYLTGSLYSGVNVGDFLGQYDNDFTVAAWVKPDSFSGLNPILGNENHWRFYISDQRLYFTTRGVQAYSVSLGGYTAGQWMHVAVVMDADNDCSFYVNGSFVGVVSGGNTASDADRTSSYMIGRISEQPTWNNGFVGCIDEVRFYNNSLTASEITALSIVKMSAKNDVHWLSGVGLWMTPENWTEDSTDGGIWSIPGWVANNPNNTEGSVWELWNSGIAIIKDGTVQVTSSSKPDGRVYGLYLGGTNAANLMISSDLQVYRGCVSPTGGQSGVITQTLGEVEIQDVLYLGSSADGSSGGYGTYSISGGSLAVSKLAILGGGDSGVGVLNINNGAVDAGANTDGYIILGHSKGGKGVINVYDGVYNQTAATGMIIGRRGQGEYNQVGGTVTMANNVFIGYAAYTCYSCATGTGYKGEGVINLSGGSLTITSTEINIGHGKFTSGVMNLTGGDFATNSIIYLGRNLNAVGEVNFSEGMLSHTGSNIFVGAVGKGYLNQTGGELTTTGYLNIAGTSTSTGSCYMISGGSLSVDEDVSVICDGIFEVNGSLPTNISCKNFTVSNEGKFLLKLDHSGCTRINVSGGATLANSTLEVGTLESYSGTIGDSYDVLWSATTIDVSGLKLKMKAEPEHAFSYAVVDDTVNGGKILRLTEIYPECGDEFYPYPAGDLNKDCCVNFMDFAKLANGWTFTYGIDFESQPGIFTIAVIPDTQSYCRDNVSQPESINIFKGMTQFIVDNREAMDIAFVSHVGDVVDGRSLKYDEWPRAVSAIGILSDSGIPMGMVPGNHDYDTWSLPGSMMINGSISWNENFGYNSVHFLNKPWYGGAYINSSDTSGMTSWQTFKAGGIDFLHIAFEIEPSDVVLSWADDVITAHPNHSVIVTTHSWLSQSGEYNPVVMREPYSHNSASEVWDKFIKVNPQIFMVLCGHTYGVSRRLSVNNAGNAVHQLLTDYQFTRSDVDGYLGNGGGWFRLMEFDTKIGRVHVRTYSSLLGKYSTNSTLTDGSDYARYWAPFNYADNGTGDLLDSSNIRSSDFYLFSEIIKKN